MRIMYLSSAYSGYVHMYAFEPSTWGDGDASVVARHQIYERQSERRAERPTLRKRGVAIVTQLIMWSSGYSEERLC